MDTPMGDPRPIRFSLIETRWGASFFAIDKNYEGLVNTLFVCDSGLKSGLLQFKEIFKKCKGLLLHRYFFINGLRRSMAVSTQLPIKEPIKVTVNLASAGQVAGSRKNCNQVTRP